MQLEKELEVLNEQRKQKRYYTDSEICEIFHVKPPTTARWRKMRKIGFVRTPTGSIRYSIRDVEEFDKRFGERPVS